VKRRKITRIISMLTICALLISTVCLGNVANVNAAISEQKHRLIGTLYTALGNADDDTREDILRLIVVDGNIGKSSLRMKEILADENAQATGSSVGARTLAKQINEVLEDEDAEIINEDTLTTLIKDFYEYQEDNRSEASFVLKQFKNGLDIGVDEIGNTDGFGDIKDGIEANTHEYVLFVNFVKEIKDIYNLLTKESYKPLYFENNKVYVYEDLLALSDIADEFTDDRAGEYKDRLLGLLDKLNGSAYNGERESFAINLSSLGLLDMTKKNHTGTGGGPVGGPGGVITQPEEAIPNLNPSGDAVVSSKPVLDKNSGEASATITEKNMEEALNMAKSNDVGVKNVVIAVEKVEGAAAYEVVIPSKFLAAPNRDAVVTIQTELGTVSVPNNMFAAAEIGTAKNVEISIGKADIQNLSESLKQQIGNRPVIDVNVSLDGKAYAWKSDNSKVRIAYKYTPSAEDLKDPEHIVVWYVADSGQVESVPNGRFNPITGEVVFDVYHLSKYAIAYVNKSFTDIAQYPWAKKQIEVMASKGIAIGVTADKYEPAANITRGDYIHMLVTTLNLNAKVDSNFDDVSASSYYYKTIGIAKKLGITTGVGNNKLEPTAHITRQDMMALTARALIIAKKLDGSVDKTVLNKFKDKNAIAAYAADSTAMMVKSGIIAGNGVEVKPLANTSRAEAAVIMYRIYNK